MLTSYHSNTVEQWLGSGQLQQVDTCNSMSILASLTMAGLGISLLPPCCYRAEIKSGKLRQLKTDPKVSKVAMRNERSQPLVIALETWLRKQRARIGGHL
jgi:DNA-binding transcriptional LysR family regulator